MLSRCQIRDHDWRAAPRKAVNGHFSARRIGKNLKLPRRRSALGQFDVLRRLCPRDNSDGNRAGLSAPAQHEHVCAGLQRKLERRHASWFIVHDHLSPGRGRVDGQGTHADAGAGAGCRRRIPAGRDDAAAYKSDQQNGRGGETEPRSLRSCFCLCL